MSFREKSAWIVLVTLVVVTVVYLLHIPYPYTLAPEPSPFLFHVLLLSVTTFVMIVVVAHVVVAIWSPRDAKAPKDERDRLIELRSTSIAAYVYAFLSLSSIGSIHFGANQIGVAYLVLFAFVIAEIVNYAMRIFLYRRGY